jgi:hypothetical protein
MTILDALLGSLHKAAEFKRNDLVPPAVLLWTDQDRQWEPPMPRLRGILPHLLTLGAWDPATRTGPAIWLRCVLARTLPDIRLCKLLPRLWLRNKPGRAQATRKTPLSPVSSPKPGLRKTVPSTPLRQSRLDV